MGSMSNERLGLKSGGRSVLNYDMEYYKWGGDRRPTSGPHLWVVSLVTYITKPCQHGFTSNPDSTSSPISSTPTNLEKLLYVFLSGERLEDSYALS